MNEYTSFAWVYDQFMDNIPYKEWGDYFLGLLKEVGIEEGIILELGCGTGTFTTLLAEAGYEMIGVDLSEEMLGMAMDKQVERGTDILYLHQDMRELDLYGTVRAVVSVCDTMNYLLEKEDLKKVFSLVNNYLDPGGLFIFDLNTIYKYEKILGNCVIGENREERSLLWENVYDQEKRINEYNLTIYEKVQGGDLYERMEEIHYQKAYPVEEIIRLLEESGLKFLHCYGEGTKEAPSPTCERVYIIAREQGKESGQNG